MATSSSIVIIKREMRCVDYLPRTKPILTFSIDERLGWEAWELQQLLLRELAIINSRSHRICSDWTFSIVSKQSLAFYRFPDYSTCSCDNDCSMDLDWNCWLRNWNAHQRSDSEMFSFLFYAERECLWTKFNKSFKEFHKKLLSIDVKRSLCASI